MLSQDHQCFPQDLCYQHHDHHPVETCGLFSRCYRKAKRKELLTYSEQVHKACCTAPHVAAGSVGELVTVCFQTHCLDPDLLTVEPRRRLVMRTCDLHIHLIPPCKGSRPRLVFSHMDFASTQEQTAIHGFQGDKPRNTSSRDRSFNSKHRYQSKKWRVDVS